MNQVQFGETLSYDDLEMFLKNVTTSTPEPKRTLVEVPGMDGDLDVSYGISKDMHFKNRSITLEFVMKDYKFKWQTRFSNIMNRLHGRRFKVFIEPDASYYWDAFCSVNQAKCDKNKGIVIIDLNADPYKYRDQKITLEATSSGTTLLIQMTRKTEVPVVTSSANIVIIKDGTNYAFDAGTHKNEDLRLEEGENEITVKGSGTVSISYRDGSL